MALPGWATAVMRRGLVCVALAAALGALGATDARAHAGLGRSEPVAGTLLGASPKTVRLTFSEEPAPSLSSIRVLDAGGNVHEVGRLRGVAGDALSIEVPVRPLQRGVYTVDWRIVSAVDGHATAGAYAFGVGVAPPEVNASPGSSEPTVSRLELVARWLFLAGLVVLLGAASAAVARFGGPGVVTLGAAGWLLAVTGLVLLAEAQARGANVSLGDLMGSAVGRDVIWRAVALGGGGCALVFAGLALGRDRRLAMGGVGLAALIAIVVHVAAGHAASGSWPSAITIAAQSAHVAAAGMWLGGLLALLLGVRGAPSAEKAAAAVRFSRIAAVGLLVVVGTGTLRAVDEIASWHELFSTSYGQAVIAKIALIPAILTLAAFNRRHSVPAAATDLRPLRRRSRRELVLAAGALAAAAVLGTVSPPAAGRPPAPRIDVSGADAGETIRVRLTAPSDQPGPNLFVLRAVDDDTGKPVQAARMTLRFTPLDDPGVSTTSLVLARTRDDSYVGSGANLSFDGRWRVTAHVERDDGAVDVPLELELPTEPQFLSVLRVPGKDPVYTIGVEGEGSVIVLPHPERAGRSRVYVTCVDVIKEEVPIDELVLTLAADDGPTRQQEVRRLGRGRFVADVELAEGGNRIAVVARRADDVRLHVVLDLDVPGD